MQRFLCTFMYASNLNFASTLLYVCLVSTVYCVVCMCCYIFSFHSLVEINVITFQFNKTKCWKSLDISEHCFCVTSSTDNFIHSIFPCLSNFRNTCFDKQTSTYKSQMNEMNVFISKKKEQKKLYNIKWWRKDKKCDINLKEKLKWFDVKWVRVNGRDKKLKKK